MTASKLQGPNLPIGTIVSWHKSMTGTPSLPYGWKECNGSTISDAESPMNGQSVPDLNGGSAGNCRFLKGKTTSGTYGGSSTHQHYFCLNESAFGFTCSLSKNICTACQPCNYLSAATSSEPPYMDVVWIIRIK